MLNSVPLLYVREPVVQAEPKVDAELQVRLQTGEGVCPSCGLPHGSLYPCVVHRKLGLVDGDDRGVGIVCPQLNGYATPCAARGPLVHDSAILFDFKHVN